MHSRAALLTNGHPSRLMAAAVRAVSSTAAPRRWPPLSCRVTTGANIAAAPCSWLLSAAAVQRRWWWDVSASKKDKPAVTGSKHVFVHQQIPVVMLQTVRGVGKKGQVVSVKRGYARHHLVPKGLALLGTWENIDEFADPELVVDPTLKGRVAAVRGRLPFDWVDDIRLRFVRWAREDQLEVLLEPVNVWDMLAELSNNHELDLLPTNIDFPEGGITKVGLTEVPVRIQFRDPERAAGRYSIAVEVISQQSLLEEQRRQEMAKALTDSRKFEITRRFDATEAVDGGFDEADEEDDVGARRELTGS